MENLTSEQIIERLHAQNELYYLMHKDELSQPSQQFPVVIDSRIVQRWTVEDLERQEREDE